MTRFCVQYLLVAAAIFLVGGSVSTAQAQWVSGGYVSYAPVVAYRPVVVAQPYVAYSAPYATAGYGYSTGYAGAGYGGYGYGGYGNGAYGYNGNAYGVGPRVVRERSNFGLLGNANYHLHARGPGYGHTHYHSRSSGYNGYGCCW